MRNTLYRPNYQFQAKRVIWEASKPWASVRGNCRAIARYPGNQFFVLVERNGQGQWMPVERVLRESDVYRWIRSCSINL